MPQEPFVEFIREAILSLPQHLKGALRLVDDPDIPDEGRVVVAGVLLHWLTGGNSIPGVRAGMLDLVDDLLLLRLAYERVEAIAPEAMARHKESEPEVFGTLEPDMALTREALGDGLSVLEKALTRIAADKHQGRSASDCISDDEAGTALYEEIQSALVDLEIEEDEVARAVKGLAPVISNLQRAAG